MLTTIIISATVIGIFLGLIGGGGSILTVPVLVYQLKIDPILATAYSLFIVGFSAAFGAFSYYKKGLIDFSLAIIFSIPSVIAVYLTRIWLLPIIPDPLFSLENELFNFEFSKATGIMVVFTIIMFIASYFMIFKDDNPQEFDKDGKRSYFLIGLEGFGVGIITGLVGAGGGFMIIPVLVNLAKVPINKAVGISLFIISIKSLIGFIGDLQVGQKIDWWFLIQFTVVMVIGIFLGIYLSRFFPNRYLKKFFGIFVIFIAIFILFKEFF